MFSLTGDIQQLFGAHYNSDQLYQEVCTLRLRLASQQSAAQDNITGSSSNIERLPVFVESLFDASNTGSPVSGDLCVAKLLSVAHQGLDASSSAEANGLLSAEQRMELATVKCLLKVVKCQQPDQWPLVVSRLLKEKLPLEMLWHLHDDNILSVSAFLDSVLRDADRCAWLTEQILLLCCPQENHASISPQILSVFCSHLVMVAFPAKKANENLLKKIAARVLDGVTRGLLEKHISKGEPLLLPTDILHSEAEVPLICFKKFCTHTVSLTMSYQPNMKVSEALKRQGEWRSGKIPQHLKTFFKQLLVPFESGEVLEMLRRILGKQEVDWQMLLSCLATFLVCFPQAATSIQEHVRQLFAESLESGDVENTIIAFLMARQSCTEGAHVFPTYQQWFQDVFGDGNLSPAGSKKSFTFLMKFLTDLVPFEPADILKVHILRPPFVPAKCKALLSDYIILAKTRLADLKVSLEEPNVAIYADQGRTATESNPGVQDVEKALTGFETTGKLPSTVMEASIFRKPYFVGKFLPALLQPRHLPEVADTRMKFIDALKRAGKIPTSLYTKYQEACRRETKQLLEGVFEMDDGEDGMDDMILEPLEQLTGRLRQLTQTVVSDTPHSRVSEVVSIVSEKLRNLVAAPSLTSPPTQPACVIDLCQPALNPHYVQVVDELLNCVCRTLYATQDTSRQAWLQQLVQMLGQHTALHATLFCRMLEIIANKDLHLADHHVEGLAAFILHVSLHQQQQQFPLLAVKSHNAHDSQSETLLSASLRCFANRIEPEMVHGLRFVTAVLKLVFLHQDRFVSVGVLEFLPRQLVVMFCFLVWRLFPELQATPTRKFTENMERDTAQVECNADVDIVAKTVYTSDKFQEILRTREPSLGEWIDFELGVNPSQDCLSPLDRSSYHVAMVSFYCARSAGGGQTSQEPPLRQCCTLLMEKIVLALSRVRFGSKKCPKCGRSPVDYADAAVCDPHSADTLLALLAKLLQNTEVDRATTLDSVPWLIQQVFRLIGSDRDAAPEAVLRVVLSVPAHLLFVDSFTQGPHHIQVDAVVRFIEQVLVPLGHDRCCLACDITAHLLQGYFVAVDQCRDRRDLTRLDRHPVIVLASLIHWPSLCVMLPSHWITRSPWNIFTPLLGAVDSLMSDRTLSLPPACDGDSNSFHVAAAVYSRLVLRKWNVDMTLVKQLTQCLHAANMQAVVSLCEILLASLSVAELCHRQLPTQLDTQLKLLSEIWRQWPELMRVFDHQTDAGSSNTGGLLCAERQPYRELAYLRCLSLLPAQTVSAEKGMVLAAVSVFARLCRRFEGPASSSASVTDMDVMLDLSKSLYHLLSITPVSELHTLDLDFVKQCGLELFRLLQQRMTNGV